MLERNGEPLPNNIEEIDEGPASPVLARLNRRRNEAPPEIIFPRTGIEVFVGDETRGFALAARGGARDYRWYVNGEPIKREETGGRAVWRPDHPGFYDVTVVDREGRETKSKVRVFAAG